MIGGQDTILPWRDTPTLRDYLEQYGRTLWLDCILIKDADIWFFHKNLESIFAWDQDGGTDANQATMFSVHFEPQRITIVTAPGAPIADEIRLNLESHLGFVGFERSD